MALNKLTKFEYILIGLLVLIGIAVSIQAFSVTQIMGGLPRQYNNYTIFKNSFFHLFEGKDLYEWYNTEQWDLFKYSPTFALGMGIMAYLPDLAGLIVWNLLNILVFFLGIRSLQIEDKRIYIFFWLFVLIELVTSTQNLQCNAMIAGFLMMAYSSFEKGKVVMASLFIVSTVFIKLFGIVAFALFLLYPKKGKFILASMGWTALFAVIPALFIGFEELVWQYENWWRMLSDDHSSSIGFSVMGWLQTWFGADPNKLLVVLTGAGLFCIPLLRFKVYSNIRFRQLLLASVLIWVIIFNHKAESATFVLAVAGVAVWYFMGERKLYQTVLLVFCILFTILSPTDLFPRGIRESFVIPYVMKAVPCILIWGMIIYEMLTIKPAKAVA